MELIEIPTLSYVVSGTGRGTKHLDTIHNNTTILKKIMLRMVSTALERQTIEKQMTSIMRWMQMEGHQQKSPNRQRDKPINFKNSYYGGGANEKQLHPEWLRKTEKTSLSATHLLRRKLGYKHQGGRENQGGQQIGRILEGREWCIGAILIYKEGRRDEKCEIEEEDSYDTGWAVRMKQYGVRRDVGNVRKMLKSCQSNKPSKRYEGKREK